MIKALAIWQWHRWRRKRQPYSLIIKVTMTLVQCQVWIVTQHLYRQISTYRFSLSTKSSLSSQPKTARNNLTALKMVQQSCWLNLMRKRQMWSTKVMNLIEDPHSRHPPNQIITIATILIKMSCCSTRPKSAKTSDSAPTLSLHLCSRHHFNSKILRQYEW